MTCVPGSIHAPNLFSCLRLAPCPAGSPLPGSPTTYTLEHFLLSHFSPSTVGFRHSTPGHHAPAVHALILLTCPPLSPSTFSSFLCRSSPLSSPASILPLLQRPNSVSSPTITSPTHSPAPESTYCLHPSEPCLVCLLSAPPRPV